MAFDTTYIIPHQELFKLISTYPARLPKGVEIDVSLFPKALEDFRRI